MKQYIIVSLLFLLPCLLKGQSESGYKAIRYQVAMGTGIPMSTPSTVPLFVQGECLYPFVNRLSAGIGTGFSLYDQEVLIPLFADVQFDVLKPARLTPFLNCRVGYSFAPSGDVNGGFYLSPAVGVKANFFSTCKLLFSLGYELQEFDRLKQYTSSYYISSWQEALSYHSLSVRLGVIF